MRNKKQSQSTNSCGDLGDYRSTYGMAIQPQKRPVPASFSIRHDRSDCGILGNPNEEDAFLPLDASEDYQKMAVCTSLPSVAVTMEPGWVNGRAVFLSTGAPTAIAAIQSLPILVVRPGRFLSRYGAIITLELDLHISEWPVAAWKFQLDASKNTADAEFLRALTVQPEIVLIYAPRPGQQHTIFQITYRPIDPIGKQIADTLHQADRHIQDLGSVNFQSTQVHYLYYLLHRKN